MYNEIDETDFESPKQTLRREWREELHAHLVTYFEEMDEKEKDSAISNILNYFPFIRKDRDNAYGIIEGNNATSDELEESLLDLMYI